MSFFQRLAGSFFKKQTLIESTASWVSQTELALASTKFDAEYAMAMEQMYVKRLQRLKQELAEATSKTNSTGSV